MAFWFDPGKLRDTVKIIDVVETDEPDGTTDPGEPELAERRACIVPLRGREYIEAQAMESSVSHRITMRYCDELTPRCKLVSGSRTFNVVSVLDADERQEWQEVMCIEDTG